MVNDAIHSSAAAVSDDSHSISRIAANRLRLVPLSWKGETVELTPPLRRHAREDAADGFCRSAVPH